MVSGRLADHTIGAAGAGLAAGAAAGVAEAAGRGLVAGPCSAEAAISKEVKKESIGR